MTFDFSARINNISFSADITRNLTVLLKQQQNLIVLPKATTTFDFSARSNNTRFSADVTTTFDSSARSNKCQ
jgi:hypothetical protein